MIFRNLLGSLYNINRYRKAVELAHCKCLQPFLHEKKIKTLENVTAGLTG